MGVEASTSPDQHHRVFWKLLTDCSKPQPRRRAEPPFTNKTCLLHQLTLIVTPTHADSAVIISKLQYSSCSSLLFKKNKQTPPAYAVSPFRPPRCICTYRRQPEIEVDVVLIRKRPASLLICTNCPHIGCCYYCCCCTGSEKKAGRQAQSYCTET